MASLLVRSFAMSLDGYSAGPGQDIQNPLGVRGLELMDSFFHTRVWRRMHGLEGGEPGVDNDLAEQGFAGIGACKPPSSTRCISSFDRSCSGPASPSWPASI